MTAPVELARGTAIVAEAPAPASDPEPLLDPIVREDAERPLVGIVGGSRSDLPILERGAALLAALDVPHELRVVSAHRTPDQLFRYAEEAPERGIRVIIAGAGGAAHLPGMLAAVTPLPVIGVPVAARHLDGMDSLLSIVQMPAGVPVATVAVGAARNAGLLAVRILAATDPQLREQMVAFQGRLADSARAKGETVRAATRRLHGPGGGRAGF